MNKEMGTQLLLFYIVLLQGTTYGLWFPLYLVFLGSFLGEGSSSLLKGGFEGHQITDVLNTIPLFFIWCTLKEHNSRSCEGVESPLHQLKFYFS